MADYELTFSEDVKKYHSFRAPFMVLSTEALERAKGIYKNELKIFEDIFEHGLSCAIEMIHHSLEKGAHILMNAGIDYIDINRLADICGERIDPNNFMGYFYQKADEIDDYANQLARKIL